MDLLFGLLETRGKARRSSAPLRREVTAFTIPDRLAQKGTRKLRWNGPTSSPPLLFTRCLPGFLGPQHMDHLWNWQRGIWNTSRTKQTSKSHSEKKINRPFLFYSRNVHGTLCLWYHLTSAPAGDHLLVLLLLFILYNFSLANIPTWFFFKLNSLNSFLFFILMLCMRWLNQISKPGMGHTILLWSTLLTGHVNTCWQ